MAHIYIIMKGGFSPMEAVILVMNAISYSVQFECQSLILPRIFNSCC